MYLLINTTHPTNKGGVAQFYQDLPHIDGMEIAYNYVGTRQGKAGKTLLLGDFCRFLRTALRSRPDIVLLNPSLQRKALARDALYALACRLLAIRVFIFFHGWDLETEQMIDRSPIAFRAVFGRAAGYFVLSQDFKDCLAKWGVSASIMISRTKVAAGLADNVDAKEFSRPRLLFLSRVEENKGVLDLIIAFASLQKDFPEATLEIAGTGSYQGICTEYVMSRGMTGVSFLGYVTGEDKTAAFVRNNIFVLPTRHSEGLPTAMVEALAFGFPVVATRSGGLKDILSNENGELLAETSPDAIRNATAILISNPQRCRDISARNRRYALDEFSSQKVWSDIFSFMGKEI